MIKACSHLVIATTDVPRLTDFLSRLFDLTPHFSNDLFAEFVLPSRFRIALFKPVGASAQFFDASKDRGTCSFGVTVDNVAEVFAQASFLNATVSGPPKDHPWGEKSFLLIDPDGNRWEITASPSEDGMLVPRDYT
jgi:catechol 2,3-dioxygenase-like lactoylglutathione lyase family enzyme